MDTFGAFMVHLYAHSGEVIEDCPFCCPEPLSDAWAAAALLSVELPFRPVTEIITDGINPCG